MKRFLDKVSIITGSSNGIGRATAILFANEGSKITITGRDPKAAAVTRAECLKAGAKEGNILEVLGDITNKEIQDKLIKETVDKFGRLDILINNHGGIVEEKDKQGNLTMEGFRAAMQLNCASSVAMCLKSLPYLKQSKGAIVNVTSVEATEPGLPFAFYAVAKAALDHFTKILAYRHAKDGIRANAVSPGAVVTSMFEKLGFTEEQREKAIEYTEKTAIPCGKIGQPEEIAQLIAYLADNKAARYITGQTIIIDGGMTLMPPGPPDAEKVMKPQK